jgi:arsenate reductase
MKKVLFICIGNTCRSQMAKAFFNTLTFSESADSAGIKPEAHIDTNTIKVMDEVGIDIRNYKPKSVIVEITDKFDIYIIMDPGINLHIPEKNILRWSIDDPKGKTLSTYRKVRDTIKWHVETLLTQIDK